ncbi:hypothetical protein ANTPLA_LOCUS7488 [Anthophora plagiata]
MTTSSDPENKPPSSTWSHVASWGYEPLVDGHLSRRKKLREQIELASFDFSIRKFYRSTEYSVARVIREFLWLLCKLSDRELTFIKILGLFDGKRVVGLRVGTEISERSCSERKLASPGRLSSRHSYFRNNLTRFSGSENQDAVEIGRKGQEFFGEQKIKMDKRRKHTSLYVLECPMVAITCEKLQRNKSPGNK